MPYFSSPGGAIYFEEHGDRADPSVLLIHDAYCQVIHWPRSLIDGLVAAGFHLIVFDNRDSGLSFEAPGEPATLAELISATMFRTPVAAHYTQSDMAGDALGLLDHLGRPAAHIVGFGMGGSIGQYFAIDHPQRCGSLTVISSTSGNDEAGIPEMAAVDAIETVFLTADGEEVIRRTVDCYNVLGGPRYRSEVEGLARFAEAAHDRAYRRDRALRQYAAVVIATDRREELRKLRTDVLVIHGAENPLYRITDGEDIANDVPNGRFEPIEGLGHDLPESVIPQIVGLIAGHVLASESGR